MLWLIEVIIITSTIEVTRESKFTRFAISIFIFESCWHCHYSSVACCLALVCYHYRWCHYCCLESCWCWWCSRFTSAAAALVHACCYCCCFLVEVTLRYQELDYLTLFVAVHLVQIAKSRLPNCGWCLSFASAGIIEARSSENWRLFWSSLLFHE